MDSKTIIIFGNDHTNSVGVIQSLGKVGYRIVALLFGDKTGYVNASKYTTQIISGSSPQDCLNKLMALDFPTDAKIPILPTCDIAAITLEQNNEELNNRFLFEHADNYSIAESSKKENQVIFATECGFNVPKTWSLPDLNIIPNDIIFPCLIKPLISCEGAKSDIRICRSLEDLKQNLRTLNITKHVLIQQYIERDYEISILGCALSDGTCLLPAVEDKLTLYPKNVGLECLANIHPLTDNDIIRSINNLIRGIGYVGLFSVEMMHCKTDNKFYFTEINLRNDGAEAFITKYGSNLPLNHVEDLLGLPLTVQSTFAPGFYIWDMHHLKSFLSRDISILTWLKEIFKSRGFLMYDKSDLKPFFRQYIYMIEKAINRKRIKRYS